MPEVSPGGLYDGFEPYRTATIEDYRRAFNKGIVVPDANVLLNLYRYADQAQNDLLSVLERLGDQLWVPHQVLDEFWRNREKVLRDPRGTDNVAREISKLLDQALSTFRAWANRVSLAEEESGMLIKALSRGFDAVLDGVDLFSDASAAESARDTDKDAVLRRLEPILRGRVGERPSNERYADAVAEGLRRVEKLEPPGYMDKKRDNDGAAGDYLVWEQVLMEAQRRSCEVVFVTADVKDDWWRRESGEPRGPRLELADELRARAGTRLFMLRPTRLLSLAREILAVTVQDESVENADRVDRLLSEDDTVLPNGGWNPDAVEALLDWLCEEAPIQEAVLREAAISGGFIERYKVYQIGSYAENRSLRGFTRPINRMAQAFREDGRVAESAVDLLYAVYNPLSENPSVAIGFEVNHHVLSLLAAAVAHRSS